MSEWQPIETAPHDRTILVFGQPQNTSNGLTFARPGVFTAYWDEIDGAFCLSGATWLGPFIEPTHWMERPEPPPTVSQ